MTTYKSVDAKKYWDDDWSSNWQDTWWPASEFAKKVYPIIKREGLKDILDVGSGNGRDSLYFANKGLKVTAVDISESAISMLERKRNKNIKCICKDVGDIDFPNNSFDAVYGHLSLQYCIHKDLNLLMEKFYKALKKNGHIFIKCKSINDPLFGVGQKIEENVYMHKHLRHFFTKEYMREILEGFQNLEINELSMKEQTVGHKYKAAFIEGVAKK